MDISLDEYIASHGIKNPYSKCNKCKPSTITSKFERFVDDVGDDETSEMDVEGIDEEMPRLIPMENSSIKERIGTAPAAAVSEIQSINTRSLQVYRKRNRNRGCNRNQSQSNSVNYRLKSKFVNPAVVARNNFSVNAINSFMSSAMKTLGNAKNDLMPKEALRALASKILAETETSPNESNASKSNEKKYDLSIQKEICAIQGKTFFYKCPGANIVSFDGSGVPSPVKIPQNQTKMTLNQRFS